MDFQSGGNYNLPNKAIPGKYHYVLAVILKTSAPGYEINLSGMKVELSLSYSTEI